MIIGFTLVTITYALLTNLLVSRRIEQSLGRQQVHGMRDHVIVVGLGSVGLRVIEGLVAAGQAVAVLERDEHNRYLAQARALNVPVILADSTQPGSLATANLATARAVAVLTSSDLANIETGLAVDELLGDRRDEVPVVLRVFDHQLAHTLQASFGFRNVRSTSDLAAPWFIGAALGLDVLNTFYVDQQPFLVGRLTVAAQRRPGRRDDARPVGPDPGRRHPARRLGRAAGAPAAARHPFRRRGSGLSHRPVRGADPRPQARHRRQRVADGPAVLALRVDLA